MKQIQGQKLIIAKAEVKDAAAIVEYLNAVGGESDNLLFGKDGFHMDITKEEAFIKNINSSEKSALFVGKADGQIVSVASIDSPERERIGHLCELAISVSKQYWNLGIGTEMMKTLINFADQTGKIKIIHLGVRAGNIPAIILYKKMGFQEIGLFKNYFYINGEYHDKILMNLYL